MFIHYKRFIVYATIIGFPLTLSPELEPKQEE
jgi:hypothetical protein